MTNGSLFAEDATRAWCCPASNQKLSLTVAETSGFNVYSVKTYTQNGPCDVSSWDTEYHYKCRGNPACKFIADDSFLTAQPYLEQRVRSRLFSPVPMITILKSVA